MDRIDRIVIVVDRVVNCFHQSAFPYFANETIV